jgi:hypothetical protein
MKCPHCEKQITGPDCPQCGAMAPEGATYCMECGARLAENVTARVDNEDVEDFDFENRVLCPDGTCTGIIFDGKCTECGSEHKER